MAAPHGLQARNAVETLIRKRLDSSKKHDHLPFPSEKDEKLESFFGRLIQEETPYLFSISFSYSLETEPPSLSPTMAPSSSPTIKATASAPSMEAITSVPTLFGDASSNDATFGPSSSLTSSPSYEETLVPSSQGSPSPTPVVESAVPSMVSTSNTTSEPLLPPDNESSNASTGDDDASVIAGNGTGISSAYIIPAVGVVTGVFIFGIAMKAVDRRNIMQYRNLDGDSLSSFSLQA